MNKHALWTLFAVLALAILGLAACSGGEGPALPTQTAGAMESPLPTPALQ